MKMAEKESAILASKVDIFQQVIARLMPLTASVPNLVPN